MRSEHDILPVIIALDQRLAGHFVSVVDLRWVEDQMIEASGWGMDPATSQPPKHLRVLQDDLNHIVKANGGLI